jgi:hypothetical protein
MSLVLNGILWLGDASGRWVQSVDGLTDLQARTLEAALKTLENQAIRENLCVQVKGALLVIGESINLRRGFRGCLSDLFAENLDSISPFPLGRIKRPISRRN